jgi:hypothetical protein
MSSRSAAPTRDRREPVRATGINRHTRSLDWACAEVVLGCPVLLAQGASILLCPPRMRRVARDLRPALLSVTATAFSTYGRVYRALGLTSHGEAEFRRLLSAHTCNATRHPHNVRFNQPRMTFDRRCAEPGGTPPMDRAHAAR